MGIARDHEDLTVPNYKTPIQSYEDLVVWQLGMDLAVTCYTITKGYPKEELFGLTSQTRRAACSVPANIAEGYGRESRGDYIRFLQIAQGSLKETETHLRIALRVGILSDLEVAPVLALSGRIGRMLHGLIRSLQQS